MSAAPKFTPGPWLARTSHFGPSGNGVPAVSHGDTAAYMCWLNLSGAYGGNAGIERANADARLIAAAPDLCAALALALPQLEHVALHGPHPRCLEASAAAEAARAALAKVQS